MKCSILLLVFLVGAATAQYFRYPIPIRYPRFPIYPELGDEYAASLADAPVGTYSKNKYTASNGRGLFYRGDEMFIRSTRDYLT
ncbi:hypothetical protein JTE90_022168 [Oedothorax gibbosus]|uniref:Uncharacterized protein n=1 Tax=Oedothorax gibbosus TaxID=931172 RepID=A0AAV6VPL8_9ARAC|nr:hypothetical protein JTE90_022168 [Oedothorax gibbosus]